MNRNIVSSTLALILSLIVFVSEAAAESAPRVSLVGRWDLAATEIALPAPKKPLVSRGKPFGMCRIEVWRLILSADGSFSWSGRSDHSEHGPAQRGAGKWSATGDQVEFEIRGRRQTTKFSFVGAELRLERDPVIFVPDAHIEVSSQYVRGKK
jgi:hypothetical protein